MISYEEHLYYAYKAQMGMSLDKFKLLLEQVLNNNPLMDTETKMENKTEQLKLGDALPQTQNKDYVYLEWNNNKTIISLEMFTGEMRMQKFGEGDDSFERVALELKTTADVDKKELLIPKSIYNDLQKFMDKYKNKLIGMEVEREGEGIKTKYKGFPLFKE